MLLQTFCKPEVWERTVFKGTGWEGRSRGASIIQDYWDWAVSVGMAPSELLVRVSRIRVPGDVPLLPHLAAAMISAAGLWFPGAVRYLQRIRRQAA